MADYGLKFTKPGFDVKGETNPTRMIFTSARGVLGTREKVLMPGSTDSNGKLELQYRHALGYIPMVFVEVTTTDGVKLAVPNQYQYNYDSNYVQDENFYYYVDDTNVYVKAYVQRYEPIMGGDMFDVSGQAFTFEATVFFNELSEEY